MAIQEPSNASRPTVNEKFFSSPNLKEEAKSVKQKSQAFLLFYLKKALFIIVISTCAVEYVEVPDSAITPSCTSERITLIDYASLKAKMPLFEVKSHLSVKAIEIMSTPTKSVFRWVDKCNGNYIEASFDKEGLLLDKQQVGLDIPECPSDRAI